jgi:hypothetical protein
MKLHNGEGSGRFDIRKGLESPGMGIIEEGTEFHPAGGDIGGGQGMDILTECGLPAVMSD